MSFYWVLWASPAQSHYSSSLGLMGLPSTPYFLAFINLGLPWPILTFSHHILPMVCFFFFFFFFLFPGSFKPIYPFKAHLFISWACDPLFLPLGLNGFSIHLPTLFYLCCWASPFHLGFQNGHQQFFFFFFFFIILLMYFSSHAHCLIF